VPLEAGESYAIKFAEDQAWYNCGRRNEMLIGHCAARGNFARRPADALRATAELRQLDTLCDKLKRVVLADVEGLAVRS
jgi:hypothetical protein